MRGSACTSGISERGFRVACRCVREREIGEEGRAGADPVRGQLGEGMGEAVDCVRFAEVGEGVAAPALEVDAAEEDERQGGVDGISG